MPYYLSQDKEKDKADLIAGWTEIARYLRQIDPYRRMITTHPTAFSWGRDQIADASLLDFDMLQSGHLGFANVPGMIEQILSQRQRQPVIPVLNGEGNYEGILHENYDEMQRLLFWGCVLSGAAGHSYGANGIWQFNTRQQPYGPSPHGASWGDQPWEEAYRLPGSEQLGLAKRLLERYEWWCFEPHREWMSPSPKPENYFTPYAAGIPGKVRIVYLYNPTTPWDKEETKVKNIEPDVRYRAFFFNPRNAQEHQLGLVKPSSEGNWPVPVQPTMQDWVLVLEKE